MNKQRLAILISGSIGILAAFLPWQSNHWLSFNGFQGGDGYFTIFFLLPALISPLLGDKTKSLSGGILWTVLVLALLVSVLAFYDFFKIGKIYGHSVEIGLILTMLAPISLIICAFLLKDKSVKNNQEISDK
ncbi:MAG: hypothetical protein ABF264_04990 [Flavobacteriales bacterium]